MRRLADIDLTSTPHDVLCCLQMRRRSVVEVNFRLAERPTTGGVANEEHDLSLNSLKLAQEGCTPFALKCPDQQTERISYVLPLVPVIPAFTLCFQTEIDSRGHWTIGHAHVVKLYAADDHVELRARTGQWSVKSGATFTDTRRLVCGARQKMEPVNLRRRNLHCQLAIEYVVSAEHPTWGCWSA